MPHRGSKRARPPRIGYDASSTVGERTGIGKAAAELLSAIAGELPDGWRMRVLVNSARHALPSDPWTRAPNLEVRHTRVPGRLLLRGWQYPRFPPIEMLLGRLDLHHSPASYITPSIGGASVINVYDLFFLRHPEHRDPFGGTYFARTFPRGLRRVDRIITCSRFTRDELIKIYDVEPERIAIVPLGVDLDYFTSQRSQEDDRVLGPWTGGRPYLLCVGAIGPRKNMVGLLEAYAAAAASDPGIPMLLIVGRVHIGATREEVEEAVERLGLGARVRLTGYAPARHLPVLYRNARALVMPSFNEGFGLPVLEAMACGCPVLAAKRGSLPEVAGDAALMVDIGITEHLTAGILRLCSDAGARRSLIEAGRERVKGFTWPAAARATIDVYAEVLERSANGRRTPAGDARAVEPAAPKESAR